MPKHLISFLTTRSDLTDEQIAEQLPALEDDARRLKLSDYRLTPRKPMFDESGQTDSQLPQSDYPEGYELFARTLEALRERYPFRAAALEFKTLIRVILVSCEYGSLEKLSDEDYARILCLLDDLDKLTEQCLNCPVSRNPFESSASAQ